MKLKRWVPILLIWMAVVGFFPLSGYCADTDRKVLGDLLSELENTIQEADERMVAHPTFLEELRELVKRYRAKLRTVFLSEEFSDGDYSRNPTWIADSGNFQITASRRLRNEVGVKRPAEAQEGVKQPKQEEDSPFGDILKEIIRSTVEEEPEETTTSPAEPARIYTHTPIGPVFEIDLTLVSTSNWGSMEVVLLGGATPVPRYRMVYQAAPSADRPIQIIRERDGRSYLIETATRYPALDDGKPHRLQWTRDSQGNMKVIVDSKTVLSTVEVFYRNRFKGLALVNRGGTYEWGPIYAFQAQEQQSE